MGIKQFLIGAGACVLCYKWGKAEGQILTKPSAKGGVLSANILPKNVQSALSYAVENNITKIVFSLNETDAFVFFPEKNAKELWDLAATIDALDFLYQHYCNDINKSSFSLNDNTVGYLIYNHKGQKYRVDFIGTPHSTHTEVVLSFSDYD